MPDRSTDTAAMVALLRHGKRPWELYADLVEDAGSALAVLDEESDLDGTQASLFPAETASLLKAARAEVDVWTATGLELYTVLDPGYPENLRAVHDRPPLVFVGGRLHSSDARSIAVVGARNATAQGLQSTAEVAARLVQEGYTVVSGLAAGIDTAAHTAALAAGGRTVAVIGTGLRRSYPAENADLQRRIASECAVVSQFWPDAPPNRRSFPMRNAVMSGIALATLVVEARETSGARIQARLALAHGRPVFLPGSLVSEQAWAREFAQRPGVHVVHRPAELTAALERLTSTGALVP
jgi:DNA processing protein